MSAIPSFSVYLFDVDGTLLDSAMDICGAIQTTLAGIGRTDVSDEFLRGYIGRHLVEMYQDLCPLHTAEDIDLLVEEYRRVYPDRNHSATSVYPGVIEALSALPGRKATATTKGTPTTRAILEQFGLIGFFDHVQGTDGFPAKPYPDVLFHALRGLGAAPEDCLFVGDSTSDMEAAKRAGVKACAVTYGYGKRAELARWTPDFWIDNLGELLAR